MGVGAAVGEEGFVAARLHQVAAVDDEDAVGVGRQVEVVRDHARRPAGPPPRWRGRSRRAGPRRWVFSLVLMRSAPLTCVN